MPVVAVLPAESGIDPPASGRYRGPGSQRLHDLADYPIARGNRGIRSFVATSGPAREDLTDDQRAWLLRSEALRNLKLGIEAQFEDQADEDHPAAGRVARRQAAYAASVGDASNWKNRLSRWDTDYDVPEEPLLPLAGRH